MKNKCGLVCVSAFCAIFWGVVAEVAIALAGKTATPWGWLPAGVMVVAFLIALAGMSWLTSESR